MNVKARTRAVTTTDTHDEAAARRSIVRRLLSGATARETMPEPERLAALARLDRLDAAASADWRPVR